MLHWTVERSHVCDFCHINTYHSSTTVPSVLPFASSKIVSRLRVTIVSFMTEGRPGRDPNKQMAECTTMGATQFSWLSHAFHPFGSWQDLPFHHLRDNLSTAEPWLHHSVLGWPVEQIILTLSFAIFSLVLGNELGHDFQASEVILFPNIASACSHVSSDTSLNARPGLRDARQQARPY